MFLKLAKAYVMYYISLFASVVMDIYRSSGDFKLQITLPQKYNKSKDEFATEQTQDIM
jgi:hypothetical protein